MPAQKTFIRAYCNVTGYVIQKTGPTSCRMVYLTQNDPRGYIPPWALNLAATKVAPSIMHKLRKAAREYPSWKECNNSSIMFWRNPQQQIGRLPMLCQDDVLSEPDFLQNPVKENHVDESAATKEVDEAGDFDAEADSDQ